MGGINSKNQGRGRTAEGAIFDLIDLVNAKVKNIYRKVYHMTTRYYVLDDSKNFYEIELKYFISDVPFTARLKPVKKIKKKTLEEVYLDSRNMTITCKNDLKDIRQKRDNDLMRKSPVLDSETSSFDKNKKNIGTISRSVLIKKSESTSETSTEISLNDLMDRLKEANDVDNVKARLQSLVNKVD